MNKIQKLKFLFILILFFSFFTLFSVEAFDGPLRVSSNNPRYFTDNSGKAIYLTGSHTWTNLKDSGISDPPAMFNYSDTGGYLDFLGQYHHNFIRLWTWELTKSDCGGGLKYVNFWPWQRNGPDNALDGKPKFDFNSFNQAYFDRLRARIVAAGEQGIYVSVMLFEGYGDQFCEKGLGGSPFNGQNNINGISALPKEPYTLNNSAVTAVQETYVRKVIDTVSDLDNVLYEIVNEPDPLQSVAWQYHFIDFVKNYEIKKNYKKHPVGMTAADSTGNQAVSESSADWVSFGSYWNSSLYKIDSIPAADGEKVSILDTDHVYGMGGDRKWVWESFTRGHNPIYMDDLISLSFNGYDANSAREAMGETRTYADKMNLAFMTPSSNSADCSTAYCLRNPGNEYLVYQPASGSFNVNLQAGDYQYEWFNPASGVMAGTGTATISSGNKSFTPPFSGDAVLWLKITGDTTLPSVPTALAATSVSSSQINLSWTASTDNVGVTGYKVYRNGTQIATTSGTSYVNTGLTPSTTYTYTVTAYDAAGNVSAQSSPASATTNSASVVYLSDLSWISAINGYGPVEKDKSNGGMAAGDGKTITLNGTTYAKGLGVHAASDVQYNLAGKYSTFMSDIGVDDEVGTNGSVIFQVFADGIKLYDSGTMTGSAPTKQANVDITGKNTLQLVVANAGDRINYDHADWANARLAVAPLPDTTPPAAPKLN